MKPSAIFLIDSIFNIPARGTVVSGKVQKGEIFVGMYGDIVSIRTRVLSIEAFNKKLSSAKEGQNCGLLLEGVKKENIKRGQRIYFK